MFMYRICDSCSLYIYFLKVHLLTFWLPVLIPMVLSVWQTGPGLLRISVTLHEDKLRSTLSQQTLKKIFIQFTFCQVASMLVQV